MATSKSPTSGHPKSPRQDSLNCNAACCFNAHRTGCISAHLNGPASAQGNARKGIKGSSNGGRRHAFGTSPHGLSAARRRLPANTMSRHGTSFPAKPLLGPYSEATRLFRAEPKVLGPWTVARPGASIGGGLQGKARSGLFEPIALALELEQMRAVHKAVENGGGHRVIAEVLAPILNHTV